jgi:hypothetical protein
MKALLTISVLFLFSNGFAQERHWTSPDELILQYAGSIGQFSGGVGYDIFKGRGQTSFHYGHVPKRVGGTLNVFAAKLVYIPRVWKVSERTTIRPLDLGFMISYHLGEDFTTDWPSTRYPKNYYWWQTSFRLHLLAQPSITIKIREHTVFRYITGYLEINTNDLYLVSYFQNTKGLSPEDIFVLGIGTRFHF